MAVTKKTVCSIVWCSRYRIPGALFLCNLHLATSVRDHTIRNFVDLIDTQTDGRNDIQWLLQIQNPHVPKLKKLTYSIILTNGRHGQSETLALLVVRYKWSTGSTLTLNCMWLNWILARARSPWRKHCFEFNLSKYLQHVNFSCFGTWRFWICKCLCISACRYFCFCLPIRLSHAATMVK